MGKSKVMLRHGTAATHIEDPRPLALSFAVPVENNTVKEFAVASCKALKALNGSRFARPKWKSPSTTAPVVASLFYRDDWHPRRVGRVPRRPCVARKFNDQNRALGGVQWIVAARRIYDSFHDAAGVVGEAELWQKIYRQENEHVREEIGAAQNAESLAALCVSVRSGMDATTYRPNCDHLVSSNDVGVVYFVAVTLAFIN
jgi:hypothetical protein